MVDEPFCPQPKPPMRELQTRDKEITHPRHLFHDDPPEGWEHTLFYCTKRNMSTGRPLCQSDMSRQC